MSANNTPLKSRISGPLAIDAVKFAVIGKPPSLLSRMRPATPNVQQEKDDDDGLAMDVDDSSNQPSSQASRQPSLLRRMAIPMPNAVASIQNATTTPHSPSPVPPPIPHITKASPPPQHTTLQNASGSIVQAQETKSDVASLPSPPLTASLDTSMEDIQVNESETSIPNTTFLDNGRTEVPLSSIPARPISFEPIPPSAAAQTAEKQIHGSDFMIEEKAIMDLVVEERSAWEDVLSTRDDEQRRRELLKWHSTQRVSLPPSPGSQDEGLSSNPPISASDATASPTGGNSGRFGIDVSSAPPLAPHRSENDSAKQTSTLVPNPATQMPTLNEEDFRKDDEPTAQALPLPPPVPSSTNTRNIVQYEAIYQANYTGNLPGQPSLTFKSDELPSVQQGVLVTPNAPLSSATSIAPPDGQTLSQLSQTVMDENISGPSTQARGISRPEATRRAPIGMTDETKGLNRDSVPFPQSLSVPVAPSLRKADSTEITSHVARESQSVVRGGPETGSVKNITASPPVSYVRVGTSSLTLPQVISNEVRPRLTSSAVTLSAAPTRSIPTDPSVAGNSSPTNGLPSKPPCTNDPSDSSTTLPTAPNESKKPKTELHPMLALPSGPSQSQAHSSLKRKREESTSLNVKTELSEETPGVPGDYITGPVAKKKKEETPTVSFTKEELEDQRVQLNTVASVAPATQSPKGGEHHLLSVPRSSNPNYVGNLEVSQVTSLPTQYASQDSRGADQALGSPSNMRTTPSSVPPLNCDSMQPNLRHDDASILRERERTVSIERRGERSRNHSVSSQRYAARDGYAGTTNRQRNNSGSTRSPRSPYISTSRSPRMPRRSIGNDHYSPPPRNQPGPSIYAGRVESHQAPPEERYRRNSFQYDRQDRDLPRQEREADSYRPTYHHPEVDEHRGDTYADRRDDSSIRRGTDAYREEYLRDRHMRYPRASVSPERERDRRRQNSWDEPSRPTHWQPRVRGNNSPSPPVYERGRHMYRNSRDQDEEYRARDYAHQREQERRGRFLDQDYDAQRERAMVARMSIHDDIAPASNGAYTRSPPRQESLERYQDYGRTNFSYNEHGGSVGIGHHRLEDPYLITSVEETRCDSPRVPQDHMSVDLPPATRQSLERDVQRYSPALIEDRAPNVPQDSVTNIPLMDRLSNGVQPSETHGWRSEEMKSAHGYQNGGAGPSSILERMESSAARGRGGAQRGQGATPPKKMDLAKRIKDPSSLDHPRQPGRGRGGSTANRGRGAGRGSPVSPSVGPQRRDNQGGHHRPGVGRPARPEPQQQAKGSLSLEERLRIR